MKQKGKLSTAPYKGVRDFYPEDMAVQRYLFSIWRQTAERFGFEAYDASILEPSELYKSKGTVNEEIVSEQTYTFTDRGGREVTLRPEMTPTVARMIAGRRRELRFPVRWYSIPNLFRYERMQRGRLREHWQLNCDIFGVDDASADVEIILLANEIFKNFGAENGVHYQIHISSRKLLEALYDTLQLPEDIRVAVTRLADRKHKMDADTFSQKLHEIASNATENLSQFLNATTLKALPQPVINSDAYAELQTVIDTLEELRCAVTFDPSIIRGFDYYTGIVFEVFDLHPQNNRAMMGGGRYDNLTALFGGDPIAGVGFGFGDVTLRDFLESHNLLTAYDTAPTLAILPTATYLNLEAQKLAHAFRSADIAATVDLSGKKIGKKIAHASERLCTFALVFGEDEQREKTYTLKNLNEGSSISGTLEELIMYINNS